MSLITIFDYLGVFVFAVSGGLVAIRHRMDMFGVLVICLLPAVGGGTLRDILLDVPVFWLSQPGVLLVALFGGFAAIVYKYWTETRLLVWADALGLAFFAMLGTLKAYELGHSFLICVIMGTMTATAGGLIRDVVCDQPPLLLKEDIYAMAALAGSTVCYLALNQQVPTFLAMILGLSVVFLIRAFAIIYQLSLPTSDWLQAKVYRDRKNKKST
jgi:uncharacterized membrane protein YeiH